MPGDRYHSVIELADDLRRPPAEAGSTAAAQFMARVQELAEQTTALEQGEAAMNSLLFDLYERDGVALADVAQQVHQEAGQGRGEDDLGRLSGVVEDAEGGHAERCNRLGV